MNPSTTTNTTSNTTINTTTNTTSNITLSTLTTTNTTLDTDTTTTNQTSKIKKNVVVYGDYCKKNNQVLLDIFHIVRKKYDNVFFQPYFQDLSKWTVFKNARYAVMWNVYCRYKKKTRYRKIVKKHQSKNKNRLIIVELGFLDRQQGCTSSWLNEELETPRFAGRLS